LPSQVPSWRQVAGKSTAHRLSVVPAARAWQKPTKPDTLQVWQAGQGPLSQQTPSVQWPLEHWGSVSQLMPGPLSWQVVPLQLRGGRQAMVSEQGAPIPRWVQAPPLQVLGATHSASLEQAEKQTAPLHL
jgi:hypothetical protein